MLPYQDTPVHHETVVADSERFKNNVPRRNRRRQCVVGVAGCLGVAAIAFVAAAVVTCRDLQDKVPTLANDANGSSTIKAHIYLAESDTTATVDATLRPISAYHSITLKPVVCTVSAMDASTPFARLVIDPGHSVLRARHVSSMNLQPQLNITDSAIAHRLLRRGWAPDTSLKKDEDDLRVTVECNSKIIIHLFNILPIERPMSMRHVISPRHLFETASSPKGNASNRPQHVSRRQHDTNAPVSVISEDPASNGHTEDPQALVHVDITEELAAAAAVMSTVLRPHFHTLTMEAPPARYGTWTAAGTGVQKPPTVAVIAVDRIYLDLIEGTAESTYITVLNASSTVPWVLYESLESLLSTRSTSVVLAAIRQSQLFDVVFPPRALTINAGPATAESQSFSFNLTVQVATLDAAPGDYDIDLSLKASLHDSSTMASLILIGHASMPTFNGGVFGTVGWNVQNSTAGVFNVSGVASSVNVQYVIPELSGAWQGRVSTGLHAAVGGSVTQSTSTTASRFADPVTLLHGDSQIDLTNSTFTLTATGACQEGPGGFNMSGTFKDVHDRSYPDSGRGTQVTAKGAIYSTSPYRELGGLHLDELTWSILDNNGTIAVQGSVYSDSHEYRLQSLAVVWTPQTLNAQLQSQAVTDPTSSEARKIVRGPHATLTATLTSTALTLLFGFGAVDPCCVVQIIGQLEGSQQQALSSTGSLLCGSDMRQRAAYDLEQVRWTTDRGAGTGVVEANGDFTIESTTVSVQSFDVAWSPSKILTDGTLVQVSLSTSQSANEAFASNILSGSASVDVSQSVLRVQANGSYLESPGGVSIQAQFPSIGYNSRSVTGDATVSDLSATSLHGNVLRIRVKELMWTVHADGDLVTISAVGDVTVQDGSRYSLDSMSANWINDQLDQNGASLAATLGSTTVDTDGTVANLLSGQANLNCNDDELNANVDGFLRTGQGGMTASTTYSVVTSDSGTTVGITGGASAYEGAAKKEVFGLVLAEMDAMVSQMSAPYSVGWVTAAGHIHTGETVYFVESIGGNWSVEPNAFTNLGYSVRAQISTAHTPWAPELFHTAQVDDAGTGTEAEPVPLLVGELGLLISTSQMTFSGDGSYGTDLDSMGSMFVVITKRDPPENKPWMSCADGSASVVSGASERRLVAGATLNWVCWQSTNSASDSHGIVDAEIQGRFQGQTMTVDTTTVWAVESDGESWLVNETLSYSQDADVQGRRVTFAIGSSNTPAPTMLPSTTTTPSPTDPGNRTRTTPSPTPSPYDPVPKPSKLNLATVGGACGGVAIVAVIAVYLVLRSRRIRHNETYMTLENTNSDIAPTRTADVSATDGLPRTTNRVAPFLDTPLYED
eukprot:m.396800 g.396800  ORF g.396800 m.396800 type:complete len:1350 (-) comp28366_c0_seq2:719-4768(-)